MSVKSNGSHFADEIDPQSNMGGEEDLAREISAMPHGPSWASVVVLVVGLGPAGPNGAKRCTARSVGSQQIGKVARRT